MCLFPAFFNRFFDQLEVLLANLTNEHYPQIIFDRGRHIVVGSCCRTNPFFGRLDLNSDRRECKLGLVGHGLRRIALIVDYAVLVRFAAGFGTALILIGIQWTAGP